MTRTDLPERSPVAPVQPAERIVTLDIVRGFALFGILTVNMFLFSHLASRLICFSPSWPRTSGAQSSAGHWRG